LVYTHRPRHPLSIHHRGHCYPVPQWRSERVVLRHVVPCSGKRRGERSLAGVHPLDTHVTTQKRRLLAAADIGRRLVREFGKSRGIDHGPVRHLPHVHDTCLTPHCSEGLPGLSLWIVVAWGSRDLSPAGVDPDHFRRFWCGVTDGVGRGALRTFLAL